MSDITIILCCRLDGNENSDLKTFFQSFLEQSSDPKKIEFLIKLDKCDILLQKIESIIRLYSTKFSNIKYIITERFRGYQDLHLAYKDLFKISSKSSILYWVLSDDVVINIKNWDQKVLKIGANYGSDYYTIHPTLEKIKYKHYLGEGTFNDFMECYPIFSKNWIDIFNFGNSVFTDASTKIIEYILYKQYKINNSLFLPRDQQPILTRKLIAKDVGNSERFDIIRKKELYKLLSYNEIYSLNHIAEKIYKKIEKEDNKKILSIIASSENIENIKKFLDMLDQSSSEEKLFEVLFNIPQDKKIKQFISDQKKSRKFDIKYIETSHNYFSLNIS